MKYKTSGNENSLKNPVLSPWMLLEQGGMHQGSGPHLNSQNLPPTLQFLLISDIYPGLQGKGAWMDTEERLEQQDRAPLLPSTLLDLPGSQHCAPSTVAHMDPLRAELISLLHAPESSMERRVMVAHGVPKGVGDPSQHGVLPGCDIWDEGSSSGCAHPPS